MPNWSRHLAQYLALAIATVIVVGPAQAQTKLKWAHVYEVAEPYHGTPAPIVQKLNSGINAALRDPNVVGRFEQLNIETRPTTPQEFGSFVDEQMARWSKVVKDANIRLG